mmetsp:Transcript_27155/g.59406  ORF Transcript_27155/g.59406 Transcript_27155/m.59406 type:complete len:279 (+) Transcript_27155:447-1283(+)
MSGKDDYHHPELAKATRQNLATCNVDLASVFPTSKVKAQILRDDGVGRVSTKAIQLIGACSAVFLRELVESAVAGRESILVSNDAIATGTSKSGKRLSSSSHGAGKKRRAMESSTAAQPSVDDSTEESTSTVTKDDIRACIEQDTASYDFLRGLLSEQASTRDIPSYGAAYRNKRKRDAANACRGDRNRPKSNKSGSKKEDASGSTSVAPEAISSILEESEGAPAAAAAAACSGSRSGSTDAVKLGDEEILRSAIDASMQEGNTFAMDGIVEDDEEYD